MATTPQAEVLRVGDREIAVTNPTKVLFPQAGYTKLDLARYYLSVADGALRGSGSRPNVLVRYPNGIGQEFFYQKRAPDSRPAWIEVVSLRFPSGRTAKEHLRSYASCAPTGSATLKSRACRPPDLRGDRPRRRVAAQPARRQSRR